MKIGVITLPFNANYGWLLQAYAMQQVLNQMGHETILISRRWNLTAQNSTLGAKILRPLYYNICCGKLYSFFNRYIKSTREYRSSEDLKNVISEYELDAVVVGSDQVWRIENTRGVDYNFFLDFANDGKTKKISYAASFGNDTWAGTREDDEIIKRLLKEFSGIAVREDSGIEICKRLFNAEATCVLDPTFLLKSTDYDKVLPQKDKYAGTNLLSTYILDPTLEKDNFINKIASDKRLHVDNLFVRSWGRFRMYKSMENWLLKIRNADFVVVDSFHGMVFCIIFKKQFVVIANKHRGNTRFVNVLSKLNLLDRLVYDLNTEVQSLYKEIDYKRVDALLDEERKHSFDYLNQSLS